MEPSGDCSKFKPPVVSDKEPPPREDWPLERIYQFERERGLEEADLEDTELDQPPVEESPPPASEADTP